MSDLQDALDNMSRYGFPAIDTPREWVVTDPIIEAARLVANPNIDNAWDLYYDLADRRHKDGLTFTQLQDVVAAALTPGDTDA